MPSRLLYPFILTLTLSLACGDDVDPLMTTTTATATTVASNGGSASNGSNASNASAGTDGTDGTTDATGTGGVGTSAPTSGDPTAGVTTTTGDATTSTATTEPAPTDGPGVLPGEDGMDAFCRRYKECGGTYYGDQQACLDATYDYWGDCPSRKAALDAFGACMSEIDCNDWNPDAYNPGSTPCAAEWSEVGASDPCG